MLNKKQIKQLEELVNKSNTFQEYNSILGKIEKYEYLVGNKFIDVNLVASINGSHMLADYYSGNEVQQIFKALLSSACEKRDKLEALLLKIIDEVGIR